MEDWRVAEKAAGNEVEEEEGRRVGNGEEREQKKWREPYVQFGHFLILFSLDFLTVFLGIQRHLMTQLLSVQDREPVAWGEHSCTVHSHANAHNDTCV